MATMDVLYLARKVIPWCVAFTVEEAVALITNVAALSLTNTITKRPRI